MLVSICTKDLYGVSPSIQMQFLNNYAYKVEGPLSIFVVFDFLAICLYTKGSAGVSVVKNPPANTGHVRDMGSIPGSRRSPGEGNSNRLRYSCLENLMDRQAW